MTVRCGGNTSSARAGFSQAQYIGPPAIGAALNNIPTWAAIPIAAAIGSITYDLSILCSTDPPAMPVWTLADVVALAAPIPTPAKAVAAAKLYDMLANYFWPTLCQCNAGVDVPPAFPAVPAGSPTVQTTTALVGTPCRTVTHQTHAAIAAPATLNWDSWFPPAGSAPTIYTAQFTSNFVAPAGTYQVGVSYDDGRSNFILLSPAVFPIGGGGSIVLPLPNTYIRNILANVQIVSGGGGVGASVTLDGQYWCNGALPGLLPQPCCPPDLSTQSQLQAILDLVTLIQREAVPFGYVAGTVHAGLSGAGTLAVSGLIGAKVDVTTVPTQLGRAGSAPLEIFDMGYITWGTPDGYPQSIRLEHNPQLSLPARCGAFTTLDYDLHPGVVVTITELKREP